MNPEQEEFQELRRLLVVKRYEQPPPGFFDDFSRQVLIRIQAGERIDHFSLVEALSWEAPWLHRFWNALERKPMLAGGFGVAVCGVLLAGMLFSEIHETTMPTPQNAVTVTAAPVTQETPKVQMGLAPGSMLDPVSSVSSFSGVDGISPGQPPDSLFQQIKESQQARVQLINK